LLPAQRVTAVPVVGAPGAAHEAAETPASTEPLELAPPPSPVGAVPGFVASLEHAAIRPTNAAIAMNPATPKPNEREEAMLRAYVRATISVAW
jgi:hypothetical protein